MKTLCLCMIVKNESSIITRCLYSIVKYIDYWVICDTGSTDNTPEIIEDFFNKLNIPGEIHRDKWKDFGHNRTLCIQRAQDKADFLLLLDADFTVNILDKNFKNTLTNNSLIKYEGNLNYRQLLLVNGNLKWKYVGVTHEYLALENKEPYPKINFDGITITHLTDGNNRSDKFTRDIQLLETELKIDPNNCRNIFYLANSYYDLEDYANALKYYQQRIKLKGWNEEVYYAKYRLAMCQLNINNNNIEKCLTYFLDAHNFRPTRLEALYVIVSHYRSIDPYKGYAYGMLSYPFMMQYPDDILFVDDKIHKYCFKDELALCAYQVEHYSLAKKLNLQILDHQNSNDYDFERIKENNNWCNKLILKDMFNI